MLKRATSYKATALHRCYEIKCVTGTVVGNLTSSGAPIPFDTRNGFSEPGLNYATLQDDYGRTYAGNPLKADNLLFTQCWNDTLVSCQHAVPSLQLPACQAALFSDRHAIQSLTTHGLDATIIECHLYCCQELARLCLTTPLQASFPPSGSMVLHLKSLNRHRPALPAPDPKCANVDRA